MLAKLVVPICVFVGAGLGQQSGPPPNGLQQFRTDYVGKPSEEALASLPPLPSGAPGVPVVSIRQLLHQPKGKALQAYQRGVKLALTNHFVEAAAAFQQAARIDPEFSDAFANLGIARLKSQDVAGAVEALEHSVNIDSGNAPALCNLAGTYDVAGDFRAAERAARAAISIDPSMTKAHYFLAIALLLQGRADQESLRHLRIAETEYPAAHPLAELLAQRLSSTAVTP